MESQQSSLEINVRVLPVSRYGSVLCMRNQLLIGGHVNAQEQAVDVACRKFKEQAVGLSASPESLKLIALLNRVSTKGKSEYCHYYFADQDHCGELQDTDANDHLFIQNVDELLSQKIISSRHHDEPGMYIGQEIKKIVQHLKAGCKKSSRIILDPSKDNHEKHDPTVSVTLELFAQEVPQLY